MSKNIIVEVSHISKHYKKAEHQDLLVLDDVSLTLYEGEIVALLGRSGSGKSTLLRTIAGLVEPSNGSVTYRDHPVDGPVKGVAMVFQNFALMPWLTVLENVQLGLEALRIPAKERRRRAIEAIDTIGLDGFESAYPKELSGGMRQRVGFARALVVQPDLLMMDEAFSALDVLTADNLKSDLLDLWHSKKTHTNGILFVTHNIEEAVQLADRVLILGSDPGTIRAELPIDLPHPRHENDGAFHALVEKIYLLMTARHMDASNTPGMEMGRGRKIGLGYRLPNVAISEFTGLLETLSEQHPHGRMDLPELADYLHLNVDDLFPITDVVEIFGFAKVTAGDIEITPAGRLFASADILERKKIFAAHLLKQVPLAEHIRRVLEDRPGQHASQHRFLDELEDSLSEDEAQRVLKTVIDWGRYAEVFAYNDNAGMLSLENPH